jgi:hypothetical protein
MSNRSTAWQLRCEPQDGDRWPDYCRRRKAHYLGAGKSWLLWPLVRVAVFFEWAAWTDT